MKAAPVMSFAALLSQAGDDSKARPELLRQTRRMLVPVALVAGLIVAWSVTALPSCPSSTNSRY